MFSDQKIIKSTLRRSMTTVRCTLDMLSKSMSFCISCLKVKDQTLIPDSAKAEGSSIVDEPGEGRIPVRENRKREPGDF